MRLSRWRNSTFRTRWSVSSDSVLQGPNTSRGNHACRILDPLPQFGLPRFRRVARGHHRCREEGGGGGFDAVFVNDHIIVSDDTRSAPWTNVWDPFVAMSFIAAHTMSRFGLCGGPLKDVVFQ